MVLLVSQAKLVLPAKTTYLVPIVEITRDRSLWRHRVKAHLDHPAHLVPLDRRVHPVLLESQVLAAELAQLDQPVLPDQPDQTASLDQRDHLEKTEMAVKDKKDPRDHLVPQDPLDPKDSPDHQLKEVLNLVLQDLLAHQVHPAAMVLQANKAHKDHPATPAPTLNTALAHHAAVWSIVVALSRFSEISIKQNFKLISADFSPVFSSFLAS